MGEEDKIREELEKDYYNELYAIANAPNGSYLAMNDRRNIKPNLDLIKGLTDAMFSLNSLELVLIAKMIKEKGKNVPLDIKIGKIKEDLFQRLSLLFFVFSEAPKFKDCCNLNANDLYAILKDSAIPYEEPKVSGYLEKILEFAEYNRNICLAHSQDKNISNLTSFYQYYAKKYKHILLINGCLDLFEIDRTEDLESLFSHNNSIERFISIEIIDPITQKEDAEVKLKIILEKTAEEIMGDNAEFNVAVKDIECQVVQSEWKDRYFRDYNLNYNNKFIKGLPALKLKNLVTSTQRLVEMCAYNKFSLISYQNFLREIYKIYNRDKAREYVIKECEGIHKKVKCTNLFPAYKKDRSLCPECMENLNLSTFYSKKSRARKNNKA